MAIKIPYRYVKEDLTYEDSFKEFSTEDELYRFMLSLFKEPGRYEFDETCYVFNTEAEAYNKYQRYTDLVELSSDWKVYWEYQKLLSRNGLIVENYKGKVWYLSRYYYFWLNFLPIYRKDIKKVSFPQIRDIQYHICLYEYLAEINYKHVAIIKPRQIASSYLHCARLINQLWFEQSVILKLLSYSDKYITIDWEYLSEYRNFLNSNTAWIRHFNPDKVKQWKQAYDEIEGGVKKVRGLRGSLIALTLDEDATKGVGGYATEYFYEEAGVSPTFLDTYEYVLPSITEGETTTGMFIAAGSVGSLDQCEGLRSLIMNPDVRNIQAVDNYYMNEEGGYSRTGLFIPANWGYYPYIDKYGNSLVEEAKESILRRRKELRSSITMDQYQIFISQFPLYLDDAFSNRHTSFFPLYLIRKQKRKIEEGEYPVEYIELDRDENGNIIDKPSKKLPISHFPINPELDNKEGVLCVYERPIKGLPFGSYIASVDPVSVGKTISSESLCAIYVYKYPISIREIQEDGSYTGKVEGDMIVASWCGRYDDLEKTHEQLEKIIEWYNAYTLVENNLSNFIMYMIGKRKQRYLVPTDQIVFNKEMPNIVRTYSDYGWRNVGDVKKNIFLELKAFLTEEINVIQEGDKERVIYGIERIPDPMLLEEMEKYTTDKGNYDRLIAMGALVAFVRALISNKGFINSIKWKNEKRSSDYENRNKFSKLDIMMIERNIKSIKSKYNKYSRLW